MYPDGNEVAKRKPGRAGGKRVVMRPVDIETTGFRVEFTLREPAVTAQVVFLHAFVSRRTAVDISNFRT